MSEQVDGVWLGSARKIVRWVMIASILAFGLLVAWLVLGKIFFDSEIGVKDFLSPRSNAIVMTTSVFFWLSIVFTGILLSDTCGLIEEQPHGFFDIVSLICSRIAMIAVCTIVSVMFYEVISRYIFEKPTLWANEMSLWIAGFVFLMAGLYAMQQRSHIRIFIIYDMMPNWARKSADVFSVALIWFFAVSLIWGGFNESRDKILRWETFGTAWDPPIPATIKPAILLIIALVAIQALSNLISDWKKLPESHSPLDDIDAVEIENIRKTIGE